MGKVTKGKTTGTKRKSTSISAKIKLRSIDTDKHYVVFYHRNKMWRSGIILSNPDEEFNSAKKLLTSRYKGTEDYKKLNEQLTDKLGLFNKLIIEAVKQNVDTKLYLDAHFNKEEKKLKKLSIDTNSSLPVAFEEYLKFKKTNILRKETSFQRYLSELTRLKDYNKINKTTLEDLLEIGWYHKFAEFLAKGGKHEVSMYDTFREITVTKELKFRQTNSTIGRFLQDLITFLKFVQLNSELRFPFQQIADYMNSLPKRQDNKTNVIAMTKVQWDAFKKYEPREKFEWEVRTYDLYRFCTNTGLRFSDAITLHSAHVKDNVISKSAVKTNKAFEVWMNPDAQRIFNKYNGDFRKKFPTNQQINKNLEKLFKLIPEFCNDVIKLEYSLGDVIETTVKNYKVMSFHSSRRSFVSFGIANGSTVQDIIKYTGWKDHRTLANYLKVFGRTDSNDTDRRNLDF